jgi:vanillate O-demethylase ferredoxin subunit
MHAQVHEGDTLTIGAPRNQFRLVPQARRHLLLAGGIGVTPLLCMAESLATDGADFELHYATRSLARTAFIGRIQRSRYAARAHLHVDDGDPAQRLDLPTVLAAPTAGTHAYVCGPQGFIDAVLAQARVQGWPEAQLHVEFFGAAPAATEGNGAFEVELARSGRVITVPASRSVAEALLDAGVEIALSCEQGICGTCLTRVLSGLPDHRDSYLTPQEQAANDQFTPCCSRSRSARLVLDL